MNLNTNGARTIAALIVLNAGLFVSQNATTLHARAAELRATRADMCAARTQARVAAMQARIEARMAQKQVEQARKEAEKDVHHATAMAPSSIGFHSRTSLTDYLRCLVTSTGRSINGGI